MHAWKIERSHPVRDQPDPHRDPDKAAYGKLGWMIGAHFLVMYALMYLMVHRWADVFLNMNNLYMSGAMAAPMAIFMLLFMKSMYRNRSWNLAVYALSAALLVAFVAFTRQQSFVGDVQFLRSMIPHHSGAILMCEKANITDPELQALCQKISRSQQEEIDQMNSILARLGR